MWREKTSTLAEVAQIISGITDIRAEGESESRYVYSLLQPNHLLDDNSILKGTSIYRNKEIDEGLILIENDVLIKRLNPATATLVKDPLVKTVVSNNLFIIRPFSDVDSAYLACVIEEGIISINAQITGSSAAIKTISRKIVSEVKIPIIPLNEQKKVGLIWLLTKRRKRLLQDLMVENGKIATSVLKNMIKRKENGK